MFQQLMKSDFQPCPWHTEISPVSQMLFSHFQPSRVNKMGVYHVCVSRFFFWKNSFRSTLRFTANMRLNGFKRFILDPAAASC